MTNQTVVSRGILSYEEMIHLNDFVLSEIKNQNPNAIFDGIYFSPFHPNANVEAYRKDSDCRKPKPGMLLQAQEKFNIDFKKSFIIGDRLTDIYAGKSVGCQGILLLTGSENKPLIESGLDLKQEYLIPDYKFNDLYEASLFIEKNK